MIVSVEEELISALPLSTHSAVEMLHDSALYKFMIDIDIFCPALLYIHISKLLIFVRPLDSASVSAAYTAALQTKHFIILFVSSSSVYQRTVSSSNNKNNNRHYFWHCAEAIAINVFDKLTRMHTNLVLIYCFLRQLRNFRLAT